MASSYIYIRGEKYNVVFSNKKFIKPNVLVIGDEVHIFLGENSRYNHAQILENWLKKQSKTHLLSRVRQLAASYEFEYNRVAVRDQSTRWGSCSSLKNLNFSWRLYLAPPDISDYVIIHELAHTRQMNHSKNFWAIVEEIMPNYKVCRKWLKENGRTLMLII